MFYGAMLRRRAMIELSYSTMDPFCPRGAHSSHNCANYMWVHVLWYGSSGSCNKHGPMQGYTCTYAHDA